MVHVKIIVIYILVTQYMLRYRVKCQINIKFFDKKHTKHFSRRNPRMSKFWNPISLSRYSEVGLHDQ